jgi:hypothetical protein
LPLSLSLSLSHSLSLSLTHTHTHTHTHAHTQTDEEKKGNRKAPWNQNTFMYMCAYIYVYKFVSIFKVFITFKPIIPASCLTTEITAATVSQAGKHWGKDFLFLNSIRSAKVPHIGNIVFLYYDLLKAGKYI